MKQIILITIATISIAFASCSTTSENISMDPVWDWVQVNYPTMSYSEYLDTFTETDEYEQVYQQLTQQH